MPRYRFRDLIVEGQKFEIKISRSKLPDGKYSLWGETHYMGRLISQDTLAGGEDEKYLMSLMENAIRMAMKSPLYKTR